MTKPIDPHTAELRRLADTLERHEAAQAAVVRELRAIRLHVEGKAYRDQLLAGLGAALGLGPTYAAAERLALVLAGAADPPEGCADLVSLLRTASGRAAAPVSARQLFRVLQSAAEAAAADKLSAFCQWRGFAQDEVSSPSDETDL